jgi:predicted Zn-dependent peptidase
VDLFFKTPDVGDSLLYALDIAEGVLNGKSGRLYKRLVEGEQLAVSVGAGNSPNQYLSTFSVSIVLRPGADPRRVEEIVWEELDSLKTVPVPQKEFQKVRNNSYGAQVRSLVNLENVATNLAWYETFGDYRMYLGWASQVEKVRPEQVQDAAQKFFTRTNVVVGNLLPEKKTEK